MTPLEPSPEPLSEVPAGWIPLPVEHMPSPTFWPAGLAVGITFVFWSLITSWVVFIVGLVVFLGSLAGWIADLRHERTLPHS